MMKNKKLNEEAHKIHAIKHDPYYADYEDGRAWYPKGDYDLVSPEGDMIVEFKPSDIHPARAIFQAILTAVRDKRTVNWYGGHTKKGDQDVKRCVPSYAVDRRLLDLQNEIKTITPSSSDTMNEELFKRFRPCIEENMRDFPSRAEREAVIKAKALHLQVTDEEFKREQEGLCFPDERQTLLLEHANWRIDPVTREKNNAHYTPVEVVNSVKELVCKHWKFSQIWDCAAGDGHLVNWFGNVLLSDIDPKITFHSGKVLDYLKLDLPDRDFDTKNGIIIVNPSYNKRHVDHLISFAEKHKLRICIFAPGTQLPQRPLPVVDGIFSPGWGNGGLGRKERGQLIVLFDFTGKTAYVDKTTFSDGTIFECVPDDDAIETSRGYLRYCCTAADSLEIGNELGINIFATCSAHRELAGSFLSHNVDNYKQDRNGKCGKQGYKKRKKKA